MDVGPDSSAVRSALWRSLHLTVDPPPHLIDDAIGHDLVAPAQGWEQRGDMHPERTAPYRLAIVARTRYVEDILAAEDMGQYVLLGAGLDTFAQRHHELADDIEVYEIDQPGPSGSVAASSRRDWASPATSTWCRPISHRTMTGGRT